MYGPNGDIIGAGPYGWPQQMVFGADGGGAALASPYGCGGYPDPMLDPALTASLIAAKNSVMLGQNCYGSEVDQLLGFEAAFIAAGDTVIVAATPQLICKPFRIIIPSNVASQVVINSFTIGTRNQLAGNGPVPGLALYEGATYVKLNCDTCAINQPMFLSVTNISTGNLGDSETGSPGFYACVVVKAITGGNPNLIG